MKDGVCWCDSGPCPNECVQPFPKALPTSPYASVRQRFRLIEHDLGMQRVQECGLVGRIPGSRITCFSAIEAHERPERRTLLDPRVLRDFGAAAHDGPRMLELNVPRGAVVSSSAGINDPFLAPGLAT